MSQQKLAEQLGLKRNNIASYEAGLVEPKAINFLKFALFFDVSPSDLLEKGLPGALPAPGLPQEEHHAFSEFEIRNQLRLFSSHTSDMQKVLEGFREFQKLNVQPTPSSPKGGVLDSRLKETGSELDNLLSILEQLLESNWKLIRAMRGVPKQES